MLNMTRGRPAVLILRFSVPLLVGNVLQQAYYLVDSIVVGNFVGTEALAAVGSTFILNFLLVSLFSGLAMGFTIIIAQLLGASDQDAIQRAVHTAYVTALVGAFAVTVAGLALVHPLLGLLNTPSGLTRELSALYLGILFAGTLFNFGYNLNTGVLQGLGDSVSSLVFLALATVVNIALDLLFVLVFRWGVAGVAWATVIAQAVSFIAGLVFITRRRGIRLASLVTTGFDSRILGRAARIGLSGGVQMMLFSVGQIALQRLINSYGPVFMAAWAAVNKIDSVAFMPVASFSSAAMSYAGQNTGAGQLDRVRSGLRATLVMSIAVCAVASTLVLAFGPSLLALFSPEPTVVHDGMQVLWRLMPCYVLLAVLFPFNAVMRGTGAALMPFIAAFTSFMIVRLPAAYLLNHWFGPDAIGWCFGIGWVAGITVIVSWYLKGTWTRRVGPPVTTAG